jgi:hypothetical protein
VTSSISASKPKTRRLHFEQLKALQDENACLEDEIDAASSAASSSHQPNPNDTKPNSCMLWTIFYWLRTMLFVHSGAIGRWLWCLVVGAGGGGGSSKKLSGENPPCPQY